MAGCGNVRGIGDDHVDAPPQVVRQRSKEVPAMGTAAKNCNVTRGAGYCRGIDVGRMKFTCWQGASDGDTERPGAAAKGEHLRPPWGRRDWGGRGLGVDSGGRVRVGKHDKLLLHQEFAAPARHTHVWNHGDPAPAKLCPAHNMLQRDSFPALFQHACQSLAQASCRGGAWTGRRVHRRVPRFTCSIRYCRG